MLANAAMMIAASPVISQPSATAGIPALPCSKIIEWQDDAAMTRSVNDWLFGFWTGWNFAFSLDGKKQMDLSDPTVKRAALRARVLAFCYEKPDEHLMGVAIDFYFKLPELPEELE